MSDWVLVAYRWPWLLSHNMTVALALEVAKKQGWWDAAGYHRDEVQLTRRWKKPENKGPAYTGGGPTAATLTRAA